MSEFTPVAFGQVQDSPISRFSAYSLNMLMRCPEQWRQRYVLGRKQPPNPARLQGSADHKAIQWNFEQKQTTGVDAPMKEVEERFVYELDERIEAEDADKGDREGIIETGLPLVSMYRRDVAPYLLAEKIEEEFVMPAESFGLPMDVVGYIDYVMLDYDPMRGEVMETEHRRLLERKTSGRSASQPKADWVVQGRVYQLVHDLPIEWHVSVKTKTPKVQVDPEKLRWEPPNPRRTVMFLRQQIEYLSHLQRTYGPDNPWPITGVGHVWACGWCGYRKDCVAWT